MSRSRFLYLGFKRLRMYFYYVGIVIAGGIGFVAQPAPGMVNSVGYIASVWIFSIGMVVLGVLAFISRKLGMIETEANLMLGVAAATTIHGLTILALGETGWQSGTRLTIAAFMMWDWSDYRRDKDWEVLIHRANTRLTREQASE